MPSPLDGLMSSDDRIHGIPELEVKDVWLPKVTLSIPPLGATRGIAATWNYARTTGSNLTFPEASWPPTNVSKYLEVSVWCAG